MKSGDCVRIHKDGKWFQRATVLQKADTPRSYIVKRDDGKLLRRNRQDLLLTREPRVKPQLTPDQCNSAHVKSSNSRDIPICVDNNPVIPVSNCVTTSANSEASAIKTSRGRTVKQRYRYSRWYRRFRFTQREVSIKLHQWIGVEEQRYHGRRDNDLIGKSLKEIERWVIENTLKITNGNREETAKILQISERSLYRKLNEYKLR